MVEFAPSLLAADFSRLKYEIEKVSGADYLHLDIMDGGFVPNITFGPGLVSALRPYSKLQFDTHLMIQHPEQYIEEFSQAGSDLITFHVEASNHLDRLVHQIKDVGCRVGIALNPATPLSVLDYVLPDLDLVLIMSVNPGFGGQSFIPQILGKISSLREAIDRRGLEVKIEVDGGVNANNISRIVEAGVDIVVAGSAIFKADDPARALDELSRHKSIR